MTMKAIDKERQCFRTGTVFYQGILCKLLGIFVIQIILMNNNSLSSAFHLYIYSLIHLHVYWFAH